MVQGKPDRRRLGRLAGIPQRGQQRRRIVGHRLGRCREVSEFGSLRWRVPHHHRHAGVLPGGDQVAIRLPFDGDDLIRAAFAVHEQLARNQDFIGRILSRHETFDSRHAALRADGQAVLIGPERHGGKGSTRRHSERMTKDGPHLAGQGAREGDHKAGP
jgi:hypothetical protein